MAELPAIRRLMEKISADPAFREIYEGGTMQKLILLGFEMKQEIGPEELVVEVIRDVVSRPQPIKLTVDFYDIERDKEIQIEFNALQVARPIESGFAGLRRVGTERHQQAKLRKLIEIYLEHHGWVKDPRPPALVPENWRNDEAGHWGFSLFEAIDMQISEEND